MVVILFSANAHRRKEGRKCFYLTMHSTHFIYSYMASDIWLRTILIVRKETRYRHMGYSFRLTARLILYAPSHRQDSTYHGLCYTSRGAVAGTRNNAHRRVNVLLTYIVFCHDAQFCRSSVRVGVSALVHSGSRKQLRDRAFAHGAVGRRIDPSWGGPIELFLVPASAPQRV